MHMATEAFEVPPEDYAAVYSSTHSGASQADSSVEVMVNVFLGADGGQEALVFSGKLRAMVDTRTLLQYIIFVPPPGSIVLPPCSMVQRSLRVECQSTASAASLRLNGHCRNSVVVNKPIMTCLRNADDGRFYFHQDPIGNVVGVFIVFGASDNMLQGDLPPTFRPDWNRKSAGMEDAKRSFPGGLADNPQSKQPPLQSRVVFSPEMVEDELSRDAWLFIRANGAQLMEQVLSEPMLQHLGPSILQTVIDQNLLLPMVKSKEHHLLATSVITLARPNHYIPFIFQSINWADPETIELMYFLVTKFGNQTDILMNLIPFLSVVIHIHMDDSNFLEVILSLLQLTSSIPGANRSLLLRTLQSPVYLRRLATSDQGAFIIQRILVEDTTTTAELLTDMARTLGYGQAPLIIAIGCNEYGKDVLVTMLHLCVQKEIEPAFIDFRTAFSEAVPRLSVHPHGQKVLQAGLDHAIFRAELASSLFRHKDIQDRLPRAVPAMVYAFATENDAKVRSEWIGHVEPHLVLLSDQDQILLKQAAANGPPRAKDTS